MTPISLHGPDGSVTRVNMRNFTGVEYRQGRPTEEFMSYLNEALALAERSAMALDRALPDRKQKPLAKLTIPSALRKPEEPEEFDYEEFDRGAVAHDNQEQPIGDLLRDALRKMSLL